MPKTNEEVVAQHRKKLAEQLPPPRTDMPDELQVESKNRLPEELTHGVPPLSLENRGNYLANFRERAIDFNRRYASAGCDPKKDKQGHLHEKLDRLWMQGVKIAKYFGQGNDHYKDNIAAMKNGRQSTRTMMTTTNEGLRMARFKDLCGDIETQAIALGLQVKQINQPPTQQ